MRKATTVTDDAGQEAHIIRVVKNRNKPYTMIARALAEDERISFEARGVLLYLLSKPDDWVPRNTDLQRNGHIGERQLARILRELKAAGYMRREKMRGADGRYVWSTVIYEESQEPYCQNSSMEPYRHNPGMDNPSMDNPGVDNSGIYQDTDLPNTNGLNTKERENAPAPVIANISREQRSAPGRDMPSIPAGTPVNRRPDAPVLRAVPKFAQTPEFAATLDTLLTTWPLRDGAGPNRKLTERALVLVDPREYPAVLAGAKRYAASRDARDGVIKNCHTWLQDEDWTRYTVGARPAGGAVYANGKRA